MLLSDKRIFIIEDSAANLALTSVVLRRSGAIVEFERWGLATVDRIKENLPVDIILCDLMFPDDVTGYDIFDQIRADPELKAVPIVAVTAADPDSEMEKVRDRGFNGYIGKPINSRIFAQQIADILNGQEIWRPA